MFNRWAQIREILNTILKNIENAFALYFTFTEILWLTVHKLQLCSITLLQYFYQETVLTNEKKNRTVIKKRGEVKKKKKSQDVKSFWTVNSDWNRDSELLPKFQDTGENNLGIRGNMSMGKNARSILSDYLVAS